MQQTKPHEGRNVKRIREILGVKQEALAHVAGIGNHYDFGGYGLDVRLGRRWQPDPKFNKMSAWSPTLAHVSKRK